MNLRARLARLEKATGVGQPPRPEDYRKALDALKAGASEARVGATVIARAEWLAEVAEGRRLVAAHRLERTGSAELPPAVEARFRLLEGKLET